MSQGCNEAGLWGVSPGVFVTYSLIGRRTSKNPDFAVAQMACRQHGNVTYAQLRACGLSHNAIDCRVRRGRLYRVHRGVYAVGRPPATPLERAAAAVLAGGPGAALSHLGALNLWGFERHWPTAFDLVVATARRPHGITVHQCTGLLRRDLRVQLGIRATSPARTLLDCAPLLEPRGRARAVNDALHSPFLTHAQLADVRARFTLHKGAKLLHPFLDTAGARGANPTRSSFEDAFLEFCARHGLPRPLVNVNVAGYMVDALFETHKLIVELDGWEFHKDRGAFERDRLRDADTLAAGYRTVRITWTRMHDREAAEAQRLRALLSARRPA